MVASRWLLGALFLVPCFALACSPDDDVASDTSAATELVAEGSPEAAALFAFLNDPLVDAAAIKAGGATTKAANALVAHRVGADGVAATQDDDRYESVKEVDGVPGVGPATIEKLAFRAIELGYGSMRGEYHGVYFTEKQAERVIDLVNEASLAELDVDASLDKRAAQNIVAARPIGSMSDLAAISRVKGTALRLLRDHADQTRSAPICDVGQPCPAGLWCTGGSTTLGRCVNNNVEGKGDPCSAAGTCGPDLVCGGRTDDFEGICVPAWMQDEFVSETTASIPDGPNGSTGEEVLVFGMATVPMDAWVRVVIDHERPEDLELTLTNPTGTTVMVWPRGSGALPESIPVGVPGDESANGSWLLTILDTKTGIVGTSRRFSLELITRFD